MKLSRKLEIKLSDIFVNISNECFIIKTMFIQSKKNRTYRSRNISKRIFYNYY